VAIPGLDAFLRQEVGAFLQEAGYVKDKRLYRSTDREGSTAVIGFVPPRADRSIVAFDLLAGVHVPVHRPWLSTDLQADVARKPVGLENAQYLVKVRAPAEYDLQTLSDFPVPGTWTVAPERASLTAAAVQESLRDRVFPLLTRALSGERNADALRDPALRVFIASTPFTRPTVWV
jgi:hypothetical protein